MGHGDVGRLSNDDVVRLSEQIAELTAAGLPLASGLRATAEELPGRRLRSTLFAIADALDRGASIDEAVAEQGGRLPDHLRGLILIGARGGNLSQVLGRFVAFVSVGVDLRRRLWLSLVTPAVSLIAAAAVLTFVSTNLVGSFDRIFRDFGVSLPPITVALLNVSRLFAISWSRFFEVVIVGMGLLIFARFFLNAATRRSLLSGIPVLGTVWKNSSLAEFCHLLGMLLECKVPLSEALRLAGSGVLDASVRRTGESMSKDVEQGLTLSQSISRQPYFPKGFSRVLKWAEGPQSLPESLHMLGEMHEARARTQASFAGTVIGVVTVLSILAGVAFMVVGLFLPLITLISKLSG